MMFKVLIILYTVFLSCVIGEEYIYGNCIDLEVPCKCGGVDYVKQCLRKVGDDEYACKPCQEDVIPCAKFSHCAKCTSTSCSKCNKGYTGSMCDEILRCSDSVRPSQWAVRNVKHGFWGDFSVGTIVSYTCNMGYVPKGGSTIIYCDDNGTWKPRTPECVTKGISLFFPDICFFGDCEESRAGQCFAPQTAKNGYIEHIYQSTFGNYKTGTAISFQCYPGYAVAGPNPTYCNEFGVWNDPIPTCKIRYRNCSAPEINPGVTIGPKSLSSYPENSYIYFSCGSYQSRKELFGAAGAFCLNNGTWSNSSPSCLVACPPPTVNKFTVYSAEPSIRSPFKKYFQHGTQLSFSCVEPELFILEGDANIVCYGNGKWNKPFPSCVSKT